MRATQNIGTWGRDEGIYRKHPTRLRHVVCSLCAQVVNASALSRAAHGKKHVRDGRATARTEFTDDGPRTVYEPTP